MIHASVLLIEFSSVSKLVICLILGDNPTVADCYLATMLVQLQWVQFDFSLWRKIRTWLETMKEVKGWNEVHEKHYGFVKKLEG